MADARLCATTKPGNGPADLQTSLFGWGSSYGNDKLWVGALGPGGVIAADSRFIDEYGHVSWKLGWSRRVPGDLTITGRRLDAAAPPLQSDVPSGYGSSTGFQASGVTFPSEGCWEITGHAGDAALTFVTFVIKVPS